MVVIVTNMHCLVWQALVDAEITYKNMLKRSIKENSHYIQTLIIYEFITQ